MKKRSIQKTLRTNVIIFALVLIVVLGTLVGVQYWFTRVDAYSKMAYNYTRTAAEFIDGDKIAGYVETGKKDEHYYDVEEVLRATLSQTDLKYYYVFVPFEDDLMYIWDGDTGDEEPYDLGYREEYMSDASKAATRSVYRQDPPEKLSIQVDSEYGHIGSAYSPVFDSKGDPVAVVGVDLSMPGMRLAILEYILMIILTVATLTIAALTLFYRRVEKNVITPIKVLEKSAGEMVGNIERNEAIEIDVHTGDELEDLANSIMKMDGDLRTYITELSEVTSEKERIVAELNVATAIQTSTLPSVFPAFPDKTEFDLYATMTAALNVGGDFYDFFLMDDDHIALVMADVSGKGIPASLFMMVSKIHIKNAVKSGLSPADALMRVNEQLLENNRIGYFVTVWLAVIDIRSGHGMVANCGHEHPVLKHKDRDFEMIKYKHSPAVAAIEGMVFKEHEIRLEKGDVLFVYTDGVTEATDADNELFGEERLMTALNKTRDANPQELLAQVKADIDEFVGDAPQFDDITMLAFKYNGR